MKSYEKPTVSVLLSVYNGSKYIKELVDSVLKQADVDVRLQVRDDGSTDNTLQILESYHDSRILIRIGDNLKPAMSFLTLLRECDDSDYYAYCDQDDVWYPNKLITAINELKNIEEPALFISTYDVVDANLNKMITYDMKFEEPLRLQDTIIYRAPSACNMVFNHALRKVINKSNPKSVRMHDFWTLLIAESLKFRIVTKNIPLIKYRQHANNSVSITPSAMTRIKRLVKSLNKGNNERWRQAKELYDAYYNEMDLENKDILELVVRYRDSIKNRIRLIMDRRFVTTSNYINILFKISVLFGKF
jgi:glycosyltransferase involved in cell wall biosynthesis